MAGKKKNKQHDKKLIPDGTPLSHEAEEEANSASQQSSKAEETGDLQTAEPAAEKLAPATAPLPILPSPPKPDSSSIQLVPLQERNSGNREGALSQEHFSLKGEAQGLELPPAGPESQPILLEPVSQNHASEADLGVNEDAEAPLINPLSMAVNKLPPQPADFEFHLDPAVKRVVTTVTTVFLAGLLGSMLIITVMALLHLDVQMQALAGAIGSVFLLSLFGGCLWGCWLGWNQLWFTKTRERLIMRLPLTPLHMIKEGQLVKIRGKLAYDTTRLTASYSVLEGCVYTEACLYKHKPTAETADEQGWDLELCEREVVDFYVIDDTTGRSILVKAGYGASVTTKVADRVQVETEKGSLRSDNTNPRLEEWLQDRDRTAYSKASTDSPERTDWLKFTESFLRSGEDVVVVGAAERINGTVMIVSPQDTLSYGCKYWFLAETVLPQAFLSNCSAEACHVAQIASRARIGFDSKHIIRAHDETSALIRLEVAVNKSSTGEPGHSFAAHAVASQPGILHVHCKGILA